MVPKAVIAASDQPWFDDVKNEFEEWKAGGWTEHANPGQRRALEFFSATSHGPGRITNPATGEITDWCGAFAAFFVHKAGVEPPSGADQAIGGGSIVIHAKK